jgi:hypothetical protein
MATKLKPDATEAEKLLFASQIVTSIETLATSELEPAIEPRQIAVSDITEHQ